MYFEEYLRKHFCYSINKCSILLLCGLGNNHIQNNHLKTSLDNGILKALLFSIGKHTTWSSYLLNLTVITCYVTCIVSLLFVHSFCWPHQHIPISAWIMEMTMPVPADRQILKAVLKSRQLWKLLISLSPFNPFSFLRRLWMVLTWSC